MPTFLTSALHFLFRRQYTHACGEVYAGIIANTKRPRQSLAYLQYLLAAE